MFANIDELQITKVNGWICFVEIKIGFISIGITLYGLDNLYFLEKSVKSPANSVPSSC